MRNKVDANDALNILCEISCVKVGLPLTLVMQGNNMQEIGIWYIKYLLQQQTN